MKTETQQTVNSMTHTISVNDKQNNYSINVYLADECKNGHNDFHVTGIFWEVGKPRVDRYFITAGSCHDAILKVRPDLQIFVDLHGANVEGTPSFAISNGLYHFKNTSFEVGQHYCRVNHETAVLLSNCEDELHFKYMLNLLNIPKQWKKEAAKAIEMLEEMTGEKFEDNSKKLESIKLTAEESKIIALRLREQYYNSENIQIRKVKATADAKQAVIDGLKTELAKDVLKATNEFNVKMEILRNDLPIDNFIYYTHSNEAVFNWKSYEKQITTEQFAYIVRNADYSKMPEGITFKFSDKK